jgi:hypothetical protein
MLMAADEFFAAAQARFEQTAAHAGRQVEHLCIGGKQVRLEFAGPALVKDHLRAQAHLRAAPAPPDLTVCLWDSVSTGVTMLPPPWSTEAYLPSERIRGYWTDNLWLTYNLASGILTMLDRVQNRALVWLHDARTVDVYVRAMPLRNLWEWWMADHHRYILHSAAVGTHAGGILLVGKGGSGKSTTAINCLLAGAGYLGDDQCLVEIGPQPQVYSLYNTGRIAPESLAHAPGLLPNADLYPSGDEMKFLYYFHESHPHGLTTAAPLRALVHPHVTNAVRPRLRRARASEIMLGLTPIAPPHDPSVRRGQIAASGALARTLPCFRLDLSQDIAANTALLQRLAAGEEPA